MTSIGKENRSSQRLSERERERERDRQADRQTDRQTETERQREREREDNEVNIFRCYSPETAVVCSELPSVVPSVTVVSLSVVMPSVL